jgi:serine/threonine protein kinase
MISFLCPSCSKKLKVKDESCGKRARCPHCHTTILVPAAVPSNTPVRGGGNRSDDTDRIRDEPAGISEAATLAPSDPNPVGGDTDSSAVGPKADEKHLIDFLAPPQDADELGRLGSYRVLKILGHGGMGVVFEAEDPQLRRKVALKAMLPTLADSETARKRFLREAQTAAAIEHDHIVHIYQVGEDRGVPFIAMPLLKGEPLDRRLARENRQPLSEVIRIGRETAAGLAAAHKQGLIHRDIKPANLWLEETGRVKILDFGLARATADSGQVTQSGAIVGTPAYMAPEQVEGKALDARCDLFSLGCVLYRLSTGEAPFKGTDTISTLMAVATETPRPPAEIIPTLPHDFSDLVMQLLSKNLAKRTPSAQALLDGLTKLTEQGAAGTLTLPGASPWAGLQPSGPRSPATERLRTSPPAAGRDRKRGARIKSDAKQKKWIIGVLIGGLAFAILIGWNVIRIATDNGELVIETDDPDIEVVVKQGSKQVTIIDGKTNQKIRLTSGTYEIELKGAKGLRLSTDRFTLTRGDREIVRVRRELAKTNQPADTSTKPMLTAPKDGRSAQEVGEAKEPGRDLDGFVPMLNGKDLTGWKTHPAQRGNWRVTQGLLIGSGPTRSHLYTERGDYKDFHLRVEARINDGGNSGVYFRALFGPAVPAGNPQQPLGYEAQINSTHRDVNKTGSLYAAADGAVVSLRKSPVPPGEWFTQEVIAVGNQIVIKVNGKTTADYTDDKRLFTRGHFALQQLTPETVVEFRKIEIKELPLTGRE